MGGGCIRCQVRARGWGKLLDCIGNKSWRWIPCGGREKGGISVSWVGGYSRIPSVGINGKPQLNWLEQLRGLPGSCAWEVESRCSFRQGLIWQILLWHQDPLLLLHPVFAGSPNVILEWLRQQLATRKENPGSNVPSRRLRLLA